MSSRFFTVLLVAALSIAIYRQYPIWKMASEQEGKYAPIYGFTDTAENEVVPIDQNRIYMFWATWCGPCHVQLKLFDTAIRSGLMKKENFYAISIGEPAGTVEAFAKEKEYEFPLYVDQKETAHVLFNIRSTPSILFVDSKNKIEYFTAGVSPLSIAKAKSFLAN